MDTNTFMNRYRRLTEQIASLPPAQRPRLQRQAEDALHRFLHRAPAAAQSRPRRLAG